MVACFLTREKSKKRHMQIIKSDNSDSLQTKKSLTYENVTKEREFLNKMCTNNGLNVNLKLTR